MSEAKHSFLTDMMITLAGVLSRPCSAGKYSFSSEEAVRTELSSGPPYSTPRCLGIKSLRLRF